MIKAYEFIEQKLLPASDPYSIWSIMWTTVITACVGVALAGWIAWAV